MLFIEITRSQSSTAAFNLSSWGFNYITPNPNDGSFGGILTKLLLQQLPTVRSYAFVYNMRLELGFAALQTGIFVRALPAIRAKVNARLLEGEAWRWFD